MKSYFEDSALFNDLTPSFPSFYRRHLTLISDKEGQILDLNDRGSRSPTLLKFFREQGNLRKLFDFGVLPTLDAVDMAHPFFPGKAHFADTDGMEPFYTNLSTSTLELRRLKKNLFLGVVTFSDLVPNFLPEKSNAIVYVDSSDRLAGFNDTFYRIFSPTHRAPAEMLGEPMEKFLHPTPKGIQRDALRTAAFPDPAGAAWSLDFSVGSGVKALRRLGQSELSASPGGCLWRNEGSGNAYLVFPLKINTAADDFTATVEFSSPEGGQPILVFGQADPAEGSEPDAEGYLAGDWGDGKQMVIKKRGFLAALGHFSQGTGKNRQIAFSKQGARLILALDGTAVLGYFDPHFLTHPEAVVSVGLRPGSRCVVKSFTLQRSALAPKERPPAETPVVRLKDPGGRYMMLNRFFNLALTSSPPYFGLAGYFLQDVTGMQHKVEDFSRRYEKERRESEALKSLLRERGPEAESFVGKSPVILALKEKARVVAGTEATVLLQGATGTGKEVLSHFIHANSGFKEGPLVKVDCSALPKELMESELFGHEKGAFTGAVERKIGRFEQANGGTLFLDEIGNLTSLAQAKLLQFLQDFSIVRVGGGRPIPLKLRVVAATNVPLQELVGRGLFREDLYYRLYVMVLNLPLLRDRRDDLTGLCEHFVALFSKGGGRPAPRLSPGAFRSLYGHSWPGNIRELKNVLQRAVLFCEGGEISERLIRFDEDGGFPAPPAPAVRNAPSGEGKTYHALTELPVETVKRAVEKHKGRMTRAARELGVTPRALYYFFRRAGIDPGAYRARAGKA